MSGTLAAKLQDDAPLRRSDAKEVDPAYGEGHHVKREVTASPAVWCETRQELCEGTPYFRSYQSGLYHLDGIAKGYLIDGFAAERDVWAGKVFVSHGGGKQRSGGQEEQHNAMQQMSTIGAHSSAAPLRGSQEETDLSIRILRNTWAKALPLIVIMGSHYPLADFVMPARYAVLGWWMITHIWTEKEFVNVEADVADGERPYNVRVKCRFQWLDQNLHEPWFLKPNANRSCLARPKLHTCKKCKAVSPIVYHVPMCLVRTCDFFWKVFSERDGRWADPQKLSYNGDFLRPFQLPGRFSPKLDVKPIFPIEISEQYAPRAVHCELCGRISQRVELTSWTCAVCNYAPKSYFKEQYPVSLLRRSLPGSVNFKNEVPGCLYLLPNSGIEVARDRVEDGTYAHGLDRVTYHLPTGGRIVHILATEEHPLSINGWKLWGDYQRKVSMKRFKGFLTQNFLHNAGEVYNFSIAMPSCPFETAPEEVEFARDILQQGRKWPIMMMGRRKCADQSLDGV
ncbi:uncharacterized protein EV422DRAFT_246233 [Fimicolochytrium jonesii]|uniref:uncharacterized protein n=1 Tax=Fimicolochytrium jonesii TaxID=1396493 RepID=UPI0022FE60FA|nr:uncharacterized protein EV422DRAFT_246233 [Fimicolochytrium jonesii]KAI8825113.1 hypothetical protein EV422DRAFT_246233 [Fimicolochytrium jonesii]